MRDLFLLEPGLVFLNHGSFGACPREVFEVFQRWQLEMERNPVDFFGRRSGALLADARTRLGAYLGARGEDLAFVPNATTGVNIAARTLSLQPGDEVLATDQEYGACEATWRIVCERAGAHYRRVEIPLPLDSEAFTARLMAAVTPRTRVLFISHITSVTALRFPVEAVCTAARARGLVTVVDGAHAPGQLPLDLDALGADFYAGNCHKWMCAPKAAAFLHVQPRWQAQVQPPVESWGRVADETGLPGFDAYTGRTPLERRLQWQGTRDLAAFLSVPAAIDFQARHDWPALRERCHALACDTLHRFSRRTGLAAIAPDSAYGQMVPIPVHTEDADGLRQRLFKEYRIEVPVTRHAGRSFVRLSVQAYNTPAEMDTLAQALDRLGVLAP